MRCDLASAAVVKAIDKLKPRTLVMLAHITNKEIDEMKNFTLKALIAFAGVLSAASAFAQSRPLIADVPFAFSVDSRALPAGRYEIQAVSDQDLPGGILVRNLDHPQYSVVTLADEGAWG